MEYYWFPRFDWGTPCYDCMWYDYEDDPVVFEEYPDEYLAHTFKLSMYFDYTAVQNYVRTLTQGVTLADSRKPVGDYRRSATETVRGTGVPTGLEDFYRSVIQTVKSTMSLKGSPTLIRKLIQ